MRFYRPCYILPANAPIGRCRNFVRIHEKRIEANVRDPVCSGRMEFWRQTGWHAVTISPGVPNHRDGPSGYHPVAPHPALDAYPCRHTRVAIDEFLIPGHHHLHGLATL